MFEMLGNWSFGDYFKAEAIAYAWEYLTGVLRLDPERLYVTVFEGSPADALARDTEAAGYWERFLPQARIIDGNKKDNFWEMGDTGPCGPCSEIHIDLRPDGERAATAGVSLVNAGHPQVVEIWNLVFMQFNRKADGSLEKLPLPVVDTGMGFERLCMAVQGKTSNYDTDVFRPLLQAIGQTAGCVYGADAEQDVAMRVVADHIRTIAFSITDGQLPSNVKAGYVIRRILRRAVRYGYTFLGQRKPFLWRLLPALEASMGEAYPELGAQRALIERVIREEEESFLRTLETGIKLLNRLMDEAQSAGRTGIDGADAFVLYDTYGFPLDLTELILREHGLSVDKAAFDREMGKQKDRARQAAAQETGDWVVLGGEGGGEFVGYDETATEARILRYRQVKQKNSMFYQIVLDRTPFYAEMGGQAGDSGRLVGEETIEIFDTKRENNLAVHLTHRLPKEVTGVFRAQIDRGRRRAIECNHTATHLLHEALREVLGAHVEQKGSFVSAEVLRFDFSHFGKMTGEELRQVEQQVNRKIRENWPLDEKRRLPLSQAKAMGAMALFGEKYGEEVRVVRFGSSVELCGGTHIGATGSIGSFRILSEASSAAGIRRIEAVTAETADKYYYAQQDLMTEVKNFFHHTPDLLQAVKKIFEENVELRKHVDTFLKERTEGLKKQVIEGHRVVNGIRLFVLRGPIPAEVVKDMAFRIRAEFSEKSCFAAATDAGGKPLLTLMLSDDLVEGGLHAGQMVREAAKQIGGGGGGQPHFATAGGKNVEGLAAALDELIHAIA
jgi:alanyl-tRNA synthetase